MKGKWERHVNLWNSLVGKLNGNLYVVIATDSTTDSFEFVKSKLHPSFKCFNIQNTKEGENPSFRLLQEIVPNGNDDILLYCHGKGVQDRTFKSEGVRLWTDAMYETVILNHEKIAEKMSEGYKNFHSFRMYGPILGNKYRWHPSGTFFAVRTKYIKNKPVKRGYGGVESWCGEHFDIHESWCEFGDGIIFTDLYDGERFKSVIQPKLEIWRNNGRTIAVN